MAKDNFLLSALKLQCPRCQKAPLFYYPVLKFKQMYSMKTVCSCCGLKFEVEPGFFYGAMFVSYLITAFSMLIAIFVFIFVLGMKTWDSFGLALFLVVLAYFYIYRVSRSVWLHIFVKYDEHAKCGEV